MEELILYKDSCLVFRSLGFEVIVRFPIRNIQQAWGYVYKQSMGDTD